MKVGVRTPSIKKSISARTTGKVKRKFKRMTNPFYGKKGMGWIRNPKKAAYNKVYKKTTISAKSLFSGLAALIKWMFLAMWYIVKYTCLGIWWIVVMCINGIISVVEKIANVGAVEEPKLAE